MALYGIDELHHIPAPKNQKGFFAVQKSLRVLKLLRILSDRVAFRMSPQR